MISKKAESPATYTTEITRLDNGRVLRYQLLRDSVAVRWSDVIDRWQGDPLFREYFMSLLAEAPFPAYFLEMPPVTISTTGKPFEFVLVNSQELINVNSDQQAFANRFACAEDGESVIEFANLGGDAMLVVPCPGEPLLAYSQISEFSRHAPTSQQHQLWSRVGAALQRQLGEPPVWLSTSGLGIYWLHIRLDSTPKYYNHMPYRGGI